jgi:hypothetical protein
MVGVDVDGVFDDAGPEEVPLETVVGPARAELPMTHEDSRPSAVPLEEITNGRHELPSAGSGTKRPDA